MPAALTPTLPISYMFFHNQPNREEQCPFKLFWHTVSYTSKHSTNQSDHVSSTLNLHPWFHQKTNKIFVRSVRFQIICQRDSGSDTLSKHSRPTVLNFLKIIGNLKKKRFSTFYGNPFIKT